MNKSTYYPLRNTVRVLLLAIFVMALTFGTGQIAQAATTVQTPVNLGGAGGFVILTKSGVTNVPTSLIIGNIGVSPIAATAITGFALVANRTNTFSTSTQVIGKIYAANYASPTPANLTTAISNMQTAYTNAAGRTLPDFKELYAGNLSSRTLAPGLYKWSTGVLINTDVTLSGGANDTWIFQIAQNLTNNAHVILAGFAQGKNILWQVGGGTGVTLSSGSLLEGTVLAAKAITLATGATVNGRLFAQSAVTLQGNTITAP